MSKVKLIIAGGRDFADYPLLKAEFMEFMQDYNNADVTIVSGMARGADKLGLQIAESFGLSTIQMPADWDTHGRSAGHIRNAEMAAIGTHLLAAWDGKSKGTGGMIQVAQKKSLTVKVIPYSMVDCTTCKHSTDNNGSCMGCDDCDPEAFDGWEKCDVS